ncbi:hydrogenase formation protein HypD [Uliginosibacterium aquaticum]|uniref:Hydrogenase maturation factor n=1 Tax=Uliginosibacterium aquaticum TaxID=2731212 RepID=A0ABX2IIP6_9RHOO|nr:hydrogenase formation protein HypD [Uliginosibacterium aquaticum]NSL56704.1 hydrogenase formation protein HypD [Uliginosibacterium aquaticum]
MNARDTLARIQALPAPLRPIRVLNVCGGHERSITELGLRSLLPDWVQLIPGPGCPVCVCPEEAIHQAIQMALLHPLTLVAFGDMLRVPVNLNKGEANSLAAARAQGADIRPIASPLEVIALARSLAPRPLVFFVAGFETTLAPVAAMLAEADLPANLFLQLAGRRTWPAVEFLLQAGSSFEAMIAPGHVAAIMGANEWRFVAEKYALPVAVAGFAADTLLTGLHAVLRHALRHEAALDNAYPAVVKADGNPQAQALLAKAFDIVDAPWRGIGSIPASGYRLTSLHAARDASLQFPVAISGHKRSGQMPAGCDCAAVLLAHKRPSECRLYGRACTPESPIGPCMVSDEGACHIWWRAGERVATA